jgi:DNA-binding transcriptional LysR family regulator
LHNLDWNDLRYFLAVCRAGSLAGAGRSLRVRHSTVSRRLDALEAALCVSLFTRTPDGFVLTDAGTRIMPMAEEAERALLAVERQVGGEDDRIEGVVRLTTSEAFSGFMVRRMAPLHEAHPGLMVEVLSGNRPFDLTRGEADLALRIGHPVQPELICKRVGDAGWSVYASETYLARRGTPASLDDLSGHDVIGFDDTMAQVPGAIWLRDHAQGVAVTLRGNSILSVLNAAIVGMGVAVIPCFLGDGESNLRRLTPEVVGSRELWLVFHPDVARIARIRTVIDFVTAMIAKEAATLRGEVAT